MAERLKLVIGGTIGGGIEEWSTGVHFTPPTGDVDSPTLSAWANQVKQDFAFVGSYFNIKNLFSTGVAITTVSAYHYPETGPADFVGTSSASAAPGTGAAVLPPQIAVVATLRTALAGRRNRGRMYLPAMGGEFGISGGQSYRFTGAGDVADEVAEWLLAMAAAWPGPEAIQPVVYSAVGQTLTPVSEVSVGDVFDTQRRRRDELVENYSTAVL